MTSATTLAFWTTCATTGVDASFIRNTTATATASNTNHFQFFRMRLFFQSPAPTF
jgi:hypothetical protein